MGRLNRKLSEVPQIFISQKVKVSSSIHLNTCKYYVCGIKLETKVMCVHKIRVEKISLFHLKNRAVIYF